LVLRGEIHFGVDLAVLTTIGVLMLAALLVPLTIFLIREVDKSRLFFDALATHHGGRAMRFPVGAVFRLDGLIDVKMFILQGNILYRARVDLPVDPGIVVTRKFRALKMLAKLNSVPGRTRYRFDSPVDDQYTFQARDEAMLREIFVPDVLDRMTAEGRVTRIEVKRKRFRGSLMAITLSQQEVEKAFQSVEILNDVLRRVNQLSSKSTAG
jgi:hypothetical protein